jgi:hypothetical protein
MPQNVHISMARGWMVLSYEQHLLLLICGVFCTDTNPQERWDGWAKKHGVRFFSACVRGPMGYLFANLGEHMYSPATKPEHGAVEPKTANFCSLSAALGASWAKARRRCHKMYYHLTIAAVFERQHERPVGVGDEEAVRTIANEV